MDNKGKLIEKLIPLYKHGSRILVGLKEDYLEDKVKDGLCIEIDMVTKKIWNNPWSGQKLMKHIGGYVVPIQKSERDKFIKIIENELDYKTISEIVDLLQYPPAESVRSLIWKPERLRK